MKILAFGSSLLSSYWNGAATYYRGIYKYLHELGHEIVFAEPDAFGRQQHLDFGYLRYARSRVYQPGRFERVLSAESDADVVVKHSGVGVDDAELEEAVLGARSNGSLVLFWDVDAPATLARLEADPDDPFRRLVPEYDAIFTYGGGPQVVAQYEAFGAQSCHPIYNGLDPETHHPVAPSEEFACDLAFLGNRLPDRERRVEQLFLEAARLVPNAKFVLGGEGWGDKPLPPNVRWIGHVPTGLHNKVNCSARMVLNINRDSMAKVGFSPPTRVFEVAGSGACLLCDAWEGIEQFFEPEQEILVASSAEQVANYLTTMQQESVAACGQALRARALRDHTYMQRARQSHELLLQLHRERALALGAIA